MKKVVFGVSALAVFLGVGWTMGWSSFVEYGIVIPVRVLFGIVFWGGWILGFVVQWIALPIIIVATLPIGASSLGDFFRDNKLHSLLVIFPLGLFVYIMSCILATTFMVMGWGNYSVHIAWPLLEVVLVIIALYSLHIVVFLRAEQANIRKDPHSMNTGVLLGTEHASMPKDLSRYIFRLSMLALAILAILSSAFVSLHWITMSVTASAALWIRLSTHGDLSENDKLFFGVVVFPLVVWVLCMSFFLLLLSSDPSPITRS